MRNKSTRGNLKNLDGWTNLGGGWQVVAIVTGPNVELPVTGDAKFFRLHKP